MLGKGVYYCNQKVKRNYIKRYSREKSLIDSCKLKYQIMNKYGNSPKYNYIERFFNMQKKNSVPDMLFLYSSLIFILFLLKSFFCHAYIYEELLVLKCFRLSADNFPLLRQGHARSLWLC